MKNKILAGCVLVSGLLGPVSVAHAVQTVTPIGKIQMVQGHYVPGCRMVKFKENASGTPRTFRVQDIANGHDDISPLLLTALVTGRDTYIYYDPAVTTGCGSEPAIQVLEVY